VWSAAYSRANAFQVIICNDTDESVSDHAKAIRVPRTVDCLQGLINVIPLQLLSYRTSRAMDQANDEQTWRS
jgi:glucosamine 6-phosphate synthetase-like amidotransferase/phosphosugar isomerase protein